MKISNKFFWAFCLFAQTYAFSNMSDCLAQEGMKSNSRFHRIEPTKCVFPFNDESLTLPDQNQTSSTANLISGLAEIWKGFTTTNKKAHEALGLLKNLSELSPAEQITAINKGKFDFPKSKSAAGGVTAAEGAHIGVLLNESSYLKKMASKLTKNWYNYILLFRQNNDQANNIRATLRKELVEECGEQSVKKADYELNQKYLDSQEKYVLDEIGRVEPPQDLSHQSGFSAWESTGPKNFFLTRYHDPDDKMLAYLQLGLSLQPLIQPEVFYLPQTVSIKEAPNLESRPLINKENAFKHFGRARIDYYHPEILIFDLIGKIKSEPNIFHLDLLFDKADILQKYRVRGPGINNPAFQSLKKGE